MSKQIFVLLFNRRFNFTEFIEHHPGGKEIILRYRDKDASQAFEDAGHMSRVGILEDLKYYEVDEEGNFKKPKQPSKSPAIIENYLQKIGVPKL